MRSVVLLIVLIISVGAAEGPTFDKFKFYKKIADDQITPIDKQTLIDDHAITINVPEGDKGVVVVSHYDGSIMSAELITGTGYQIIFDGNKSHFYRTPKTAKVTDIPLKDFKKYKIVAAPPAKESQDAIKNK